MDPKFLKNLSAEALKILNTSDHSVTIHVRQIRRP